MILPATRVQRLSAAAKKAARMRARLAETRRVRQQQPSALPVSKHSQTETEQTEVGGSTASTTDRPA
jgi:hypothetical protein